MANLQQKRRNTLLSVLTAHLNKKLPSNQKNQARPFSRVSLY